MKKIPMLLSMILLITMIVPIGNFTVSSTPVTADIIVAKDGSGNYKTVQDAVNAASVGDTIYVKNGVYKEVVTISKDGIHLIGESNTATIITYDNYAGKPNDSGGTYGTSGSATFYVKSQNVTLENIYIENSFDENTNTDGKQAVAVYIKGDRNIIKNCVFVANQDTLYANNGRQYYYKCRIVGDTDFIFGAATAVFDQCDIVSTVKGGYVTAASTDINDYGYLFIDCKLTSDAKANSTYLGRPWRPNAYVVYKNCYLGEHIRTDGWTSMSNNSPENARFFEYKNYGPGAVVNSSRRQLTDAEAETFTPQNILKGTDNWNPVIVEVFEPLPIDGALISKLLVQDEVNYSNWSIQNNLQVGNEIFGDRTFTITDLPAKLLGAEWIKTACDSKTFTNDLATFIAKDDITVYIALDSRVTNAPQWLSGWEKTTDTMLVTASPELTFNLYKKDFNTNAEVTLGSNGTSSGVVNYSVIVTPHQVEELLLGDLTGDGIVNVNDLLTMKDFILKGNVVNSIELGDLNSDGVINCFDYAILKREIFR